MNNCILAIDAGGTFFKYCPLKEDGTLLEKPEKLPVNSCGEKEDILFVYKEIINTVSKKYTVTGIGVSTPGPFDFINGISLMTHKFTGIYKVNLKEELQKIINVPVWFCPDACTFLAGEFYYQKHGFNNMIGVTLGTGLGFSVVKDKKLLLTEKGETIENIYNLKTGDNILEYYVSGKGIKTIYENLTGKQAKNALAVSVLARNGDKNALKAFYISGEYLAKALLPKIEKYSAECVVLGGQVSYSFDLIYEGMKGILNKSDCIVKRAESIDNSPIYGVLYFRNKGEK